MYTRQIIPFYYLIINYLNSRMYTRQIINFSSVDDFKSSRASSFFSNDTFIVFIHCINLKYVCQDK